ncbi:MAG: hypothetical protein NTW05_11490 [Pseudonocardiales bacterium]|nr:hypothetical protein [Pseudonocardiales bacterium]
MPRHLTAVAVAVALAELAGCSSQPDLGPVFNDEASADLRCLAHQEGEPGARYTDPAVRETGTVLALMRYYTAHGTKPFCDGAPAGDADRAWARAYLELGGTTERLAPNLR